MTVEETLNELVGRLGWDSDHVISWEHYREWPSGALEMLNRSGWVAPAEPASSIECTGCEENCFMPVVIRPLKHGATQAYVECDRRDDMGRINVPIDRLRQWQVTTNQVARWVRSQLGVKDLPRRVNPSTISIGTVRGQKRSGRLELVADRDQVSLRISGHLLPLTEAVLLNNGEIEIDRAAIIALIDLPSRPASRLKKPSLAPREARKLQTQSKYARWQKEYRRLRRAYPDKSDVWYSRKIAKTEVAEGKSPETIRKNMK